MTKADIIREVRTGMKLTYDELAEKTGTDRQTVIGWEMGVLNPTREEAAKIKEVLGVDVLDTDMDIRVSRQKLNAISIFAASGWLLAVFFLMILILQG